MSTNPEPMWDGRAEEEDWFGEGTVFRTEEELAAALLKLAGDRPPGGPAGEPAPPALDAPPEFELLEHPTASGANGQATGLGAPPPRTWSVRQPGIELLPPRQPGRTGWSIRNSVRMLEQLEDIMRRLREEAVTAAFIAAARAMYDRSEDYSVAVAAVRSESCRRIRL